MSSTRPVVLHRQRPPIAVPGANVYFAFPSGRLAYDCATCGAKCCRGFGYMLNDAAELRQQLSRRPSLKFFVRPVGLDGRFEVMNCPPACFFLDSHGSCGIQLEDGYDAKPETCRLFPFNQFKRFGEHLVVLPHPYLCPLRVTSPGESSDTSRHEPLLTAMVSDGLRLDVPHVAVGRYTGDSLIALERRLLASAERYSSTAAPSYDEFAEEQLRETMQSSQRPAASNGMGAFTATLHSVLGITSHMEPAQEAVLARTMSALTPTLRAMLIFRSREATDLPFIELERIPHVLLCLHALVRSAHGAGMSDITYQTVLRLFTTCGPLLATLAHVDRAMEWDPAASIALAIARGGVSQEKYIDVAKALLPREQQRHRASLGEILCRLVEDDVERVLFLNAIATELAGRLRPVGTPHDRVASSLRCRLQRWALGHLSGERLMALAAVQQRRPATSRP